ncbi:hypothetical protein DCC79_01995 [bacterium]|nr:MAG: hypothetical protein DCC79_01995 [bacterium]
MPPRSDGRARAAGDPNGLDQDRAHRGDGPPPSAGAALVPAPEARAALRTADALGTSHPVDVYVERLRTAVSRETTERKLDMVARVLAELWPGSVDLDHVRGARYGVPWLALTPVACERLRSALADRWAPATANAALAAIRGVLRAAWLAGAFDADGRDRLFEGLRAVRGDRAYVKRDAPASPAPPADAAPSARAAGSAVPAPGPAGGPLAAGTPMAAQGPHRGRDAPIAAPAALSPARLAAWIDAESEGEPGRHLETGELAALWSCAGGDEHPVRAARNLAVLALLYGCGLRAGEAVAIDLSDVDTADEPGVRIFGKGRKRRVVPLPFAAVAPIQRWLAVRGRAPGPLLLPVLKNDTVLHARADGRPARLTPQALTGVCLFLADRAGLPPFRAHDLRRTFAGQHLDAGTDIATVAQLMGHANVTTTSRYDRRPDRARRDAQGKLWMPEPHGAPA